MMNLGLNTQPTERITLADKVRQILARNKSEEGLIVTAVGSPGAPADMLELAARIGHTLTGYKAILRSGGSSEIELAFESAWRNAASCEIFHPVHNYKPRDENGLLNVDKLIKRRRPYQGLGSPIVLTCDQRSAAEASAKTNHPGWDRSSPGMRAHLVSNVPQVLGAAMTRPTDLVIAWTPDGRASGVAGHAMRLAQRNGIEVLNIKRAPEREALLEALDL